MLNQLFANWFTAITGIATLISVFIQLRGSLGQYKDVIERIIYATAGLFVGSLIGNVKISSINISFADNGVYYMVLSVQFISAVVAIYLINDQAKTQKPHADPITILLLIFFVLFIYHIVRNFPHVPSDEESLTIQEYSLLANNAEKSGEYARAIFFLKEIENTFRTSLPYQARVAIDAKIDKLTEQEIQLK